MIWAVSLWVKAHTAWFCTLPVTLRLTKGSERRKSGIIKGFFFLIVSLETHDHQDDMFSELRWILKSQLLVSNNKKGKKKRNNNKNTHFSHSEYDKKKEMCIKFGAMIHCFCYGSFSGEALSRKMSRWKSLTQSYQREGRSPTPPCGAFQERYVCFNSHEHPWNSHGRSELKDLLFKFLCMV